MARDKNGKLIPRKRETQEAFNRHISQIKDVWSTEPLLAIPDVRGLRPKDIDELGVDSMRLLGLISRLEPSLATVGEDMVAERDSRVRIKPPIGASDHTLKPADLKKLLERYRSRDTRAGSGSVSGEFELPSIILEPKITTRSFTSQRLASRSADASDSDLLSPQMLTRSKRKRKHGLTTKNPPPTAKRTSRLAEITEPPKAPQVRRRPPQQQQLTTKRKRTEKSAVNLAGTVKESLNALGEPDKKPEEAVEAAMTDTVSAQSEANKPLVPIWHQYIETSHPAPFINPVRVEINRLKTSCGDMMFFIEGAARGHKLKPLTESQKETLTYDSEVCERALKNVLDAYLKKLEDAGIVPRIVHDPPSPIQVSNGDSDVGSDADPMDLVESFVPTASQKQSVPIFDETNLPGIRLTPPPQRFQPYTGLLNAPNDTMTAQSETRIRPSTSSPSSMPEIPTTGMFGPSGPAYSHLTGRFTLGFTSPGQRWN